MLKVALSKKGNEITGKVNRDFLDMIETVYDTDGNDVTITEGVAEISLADSYVSKEGYTEFTSDEKDKLANL